MKQKTKQVTKPVVSLERPGGKKINLWVLDAGQHCECAPQNSMRYFAGKTGSLIYEQKNISSHHCCEYGLQEPSIWSWIQKWMRHGLEAHDTLSKLADALENVADSELDRDPESRNFEDDTIEAINGLVSEARAILKAME